MTMPNKPGEKTDIDAANRARIEAMRTKRVAKPTEPAPAGAPSAASPEKIEEIAREVIAGKWGSGAERVEKLNAAGYDADAVQKCVNQLLK